MQIAFKIFPNIKPTALFPLESIRKCFDPLVLPLKSTGILRLLHFGKQTVIMRVMKTTSEISLGLTKASYRKCCLLYFAKVK